MCERGHVHFVGVEPPQPARRVRSPAPSPPPDPGGIEPFVATLFAAHGLDASTYGPSSLRRRTAACLRALRVPSGEAAADLLGARPDLAPRALSALLVGVTGFFRDARVFADLAALLPSLAPNARVCSMGVSDGRELYSVAMLLDEAGRLDGSRLVGVDCRADVLDRARAARYRPDDLRGVSPERRARHFERVDGGWRVRPSLARRVEWRLGTVAAPPEDEVDLLLFRNVSIYLEPAAATRAWHALLDRLAPGGVVVTGPAERPPPEAALRQVGACTWRR